MSKLTKLTKENTNYEGRSFPTTIQQERKPSGFLYGSHRRIRQNCEARDLAYEAILALYSGNVDESKEKARKSMAMNPECTDAYLARLLAMTQLVDGDTVLYGLRELLGRAQEMYCLYFHHRVCYQMTRTRPYIRILMAIGSVAYGMNRIDIATEAYEVVIGANGTDAPNARNPLVSCYLILIGLTRRGQSMDLIRTATHLEELVNLEYEGRDVFDEDKREPMKRWARIFLIYMQAGESAEWERLVRREFRASEDLILSILDPAGVEKNPIPKVFFDTDERDFEDVIDDDVVDIEGDRVYEMLPPIEDFTTIDYLKRAMKEWPDMASAIKKALKLESQDEQGSERQSSDSFNGINDDKARGQECYRKIQELINESRIAIQEGRYRDGLNACTKAKQIVLGMIPTSERWYIHASFVIASNRATCAALLEEWELARLDSMITLLMKPDHIRTYERLPRIALGMCSPRLAEFVRSWLTRMKEAPADDTDWEAKAQNCIAMMRLMVIWSARLTDQWTDELEEALYDGVGEFFTPIYWHRNKLPPYLSSDDFCEEDELPHSTRSSSRIVMNTMRRQEEDMAWVVYATPKAFPFLPPQAVKQMFNSRPHR